jgi:purine-nucleoside phosphorylase
MKARRSLPIGGARVGIVLGTGAGGVAARLGRARSTPCAAIPGLVSPGVAGHAGELLTGELSGVRVAVLSGRPHFYEGHSMAQVVAGVRALARAGVRAVILTNAAGGIRPSLSPGDLMVVADHVNAFGTNPLIGDPEMSSGAPFVDMTAAYDVDFRRLARTAARRLGFVVQEGVYVGVSGPSYETPAEVRLWKRLGADAVGMSTVPEVIALRRAGVRVLAISTITNMAAGLSRARLEHDDVLETGRKAASRLGDLLVAIVPAIDASLPPRKACRPPTPSPPGPVHREVTGRRAPRPIGKKAAKVLFSSFEHSGAYNFRHRKTEKQKNELPGRTRLITGVRFYEVLLSGATSRKSSTSGAEPCQRRPRSEDAARGGPVNWEF